MKKVIITGASGTIGEVVVGALREDHQLILFDQKPHPQFPVEIVDLSDWEAVKFKIPSADAIVHLAAIPYEDDAQKILKNNIQTTLNIFEAARINNIKKVIFASSEMTYWGYLNSDLKPRQPLHPNLHTWPRTHYAVSKIYGENLGKVYAANFNISVICLRLGWFPRIPTQPKHLANNLPILLSLEDCKRLFQKCVSVDGIDFVVVNGFSQAAKEYYDLDYTQEALGFYPQDNLAETVRQHSIRLGFAPESLTILAAAYSSEDLLTR
jgi:uronate dehydrogenase